MLPTLPLRTTKPPSRWAAPWAVLSMMERLVQPFSEFSYDLIQMFLFFRAEKLGLMRPSKIICLALPRQRRKPWQDGRSPADWHSEIHGMEHAAEF